jgi:uncharacterized membrane protein YbhN (UPF0104 family)
VSAQPNRSRWLAAARIALSVVALGLVARWVDAAAVIERLSTLRPGWVALALGISVLQVGLLAWRWRLTAARLGLDLPFADAVAEYYLGIFVNQVVPGGVLGDVSRAWRHARATTRAGPAIRAVLLERVSAQLVMALVAVASLLFLPLPGGAWVVAAACVVAMVVMLALRRRPDPEGTVGRLWSDVRRAWLAADVFALQLVSAVAVVASYIAVFVVAARAVGADLPLAALLPLVAPVLMTMLVPLTVAGWGVREAAAAALWSVVGLAPEEGAAVSVAYGLLVLISSAPGLVVLTRVLSAGPDRRAHPPRG